MTTNSLLAKIWSFCDTLRDDGLNYGEYLEQLTYLLFLKMTDENKGLHKLPPQHNWTSLKNKEKGDLIGSYEETLKKLAQSGGMLEKIFSGAQNKIHDSTKLKKLIKLIDEENWSSYGSDIKGAIYESLLQKNAESSGAGQYFTPRPVINAIVRCIQPNLGETIADPSCGTGGFFLGALDYLSGHSLNEKEKRFLKFDTFHGWEIESSTARLCLMNLFLHGIGDLKETPDIEVSDSLKKPDSKKVNIVLANPPFGRNSSDIPTPDEKLASKEGYFFRPDFWITTSNKQLAFLQHIVTMLSQGGRAAVVLPDNVLFEAGVGEIVRKKLLDGLNLHTILRLPTGIFYAHGVKANVLFFEKVTQSKQPVTKEVWYYDYRTNVRHTLKKNPLTAENLNHFVSCYSAGNMKSRKETWSEKNPIGRWKKFNYEELVSQDKVNLDLFWINDDNLIDTENLPEPDDLMADIIENLESVLQSLKSVRESVS